MTSAKTNETWDVVVIGSGAGGLTAATALSNLGRKVLVLEQHYLPGGWTHTFALDGHKFSPGVHYIGQLGEGGGTREILEGIGVANDIEFNELNPDGYDWIDPDLAATQQSIQARARQAAQSRHQEIVDPLAVLLGRNGDMLDFRRVQEDFNVLSVS